MDDDLQLNLSGLGGVPVVKKRVVREPRGRKRKSGMRTLSPEKKTVAADPKENNPFIRRKQVDAGELVSVVSQNNQDTESEEDTACSSTPVKTQKETLQRVALDNHAKKVRNGEAEVDTDEDASFNDFGLLPLLCKEIEDKLQIRVPTRIQRAVLRENMKHPSKDFLIHSSTGSGKTLAYVLPLLHSLLHKKERLSREDGTRMLIIAPTRELCLQIHHVIEQLTASAFHWIVSGVITGGEKKKAEKARIRKGISILVATPGRLLDHLQNTQALKVDQLNSIVLDEADRLMDLGFLPKVLQILTILQSRMNTQKHLRSMLVSATLSPSIDSLAKDFLKDHAFLSSKDIDLERVHDVIVDLPKGLVQGYVVVPHKNRFIALLSFLRWKLEAHDDLKAVVFMSSCAEVEFYFALLSHAALGLDSIPLFSLHGNASQLDRSSSFIKFANSTSGILLCTNVAARGLDFPEVDWIVQFDPPEDMSEYVHRVGRTARIGRKGRAVLFLAPPHETHMIDYMQQKAPGSFQFREMSLSGLLQTLDSFSFEVMGFSTAEWDTQHDVSPTTKMHALLAWLLNRDTELQELAKKGFVSFVRSYASYPKETRRFFNVKNLHYGHVAKSFALKDTPTEISNYVQTSHTHEMRQLSHGPIRPKQATDNALKMAKAIRTHMGSSNLSEFM